MTSWKDNAERGPHLELVGRVALERAKSFVLHRGHAFVCGHEHGLHVVDVQSPSQPTLVTTLELKKSVSAACVRGDALFVGESGRALHFFDIAEPAKPRFIDCGVALDMIIYQVERLGGFVVAALNWEGIGLMDVENPKKARWVSRLSLAEGFIENFVIVRDRIFAAGASGGLVVFDIHQGALRKIAHHEGGFNATSVFAVNDMVWATGSNAKDKNTILVVDPDKPDTILHTMVTKESLPVVLAPLPSGQAVGFFSHYTCGQYDPAGGEAGVLFRQFTDRNSGAYVEVPEDGDTRRNLECMENITHLERQGDLLYAAQNNELIIYRATPTSAFAAVT